MPDIPIANGPPSTIPEWARDALIGSHRAIAGIYKALDMAAVSAMHEAEVARLQNLDSEVKGLAEQLAAGWTISNAPTIICDGKFFSHDWDSLDDPNPRCKRCGVFMYRRK